MLPAPARRPGRASWGRRGTGSGGGARRCGRGRGARGPLLRLGRPPLRPGEWRTLGLFAAADAGQLEEVLASMPLRVWRTDEVTALSPHPNDPALAAGNTGTEFLTTFT